MSRGERQHGQPKATHPVPLVDAHSITRADYEKVYRMLRCGQPVGYTTYEGWLLILMATTAYKTRPNRYLTNNFQGWINPQNKQRWLELMYFHIEQGHRVNLTPGNTY